MTLFRIVFYVCLTALYIMSDIARSSNANVLQSKNPENEPSNDCLDCICQAMSSCNSSVGCDQGACGMYRITREYWIDSDRPMPKGEKSKNRGYEVCANDPNCARESAANYLTKFAQDCNGDGTIDCDDYSAIHMQGGYGCGDPLEKNYKYVYEDCMYNALVGEVFGKDVSPPSSSSSSPPSPPPPPPTANDQNDRIIFPDS